MQMQTRGISHFIYLCNLRHSNRTPEEFVEHVSLIFRISFENNHKIILDFWGSMNKKTKI